MTVYGGYLQFFMRLSGLLTPAELDALGLPSSKCLFLTHNLTSLLLVGSGTCYALILNLDGTGQPIALFVIKSLFHISAVATYFFLMTRHILLQRSYAGIRRYLSVSQEFLHPPLADKNFKLFLALFFTTIITWRTANAVQDLLKSQPTEVFHVLGATASMISHTYSILYALKIVLITRQVKIHFLRANRHLAGRIKSAKHSKFCTLSKVEFEKLTKYQWDCFDFLDKLNKTTGPDCFMMTFSMYIAILYRLYNASAYSALFTAEEIQVEKAFTNLGQSALNVMISLILLGNGTNVRHEIKNTTEMIWNAAPEITCVDCRKKFDVFAEHVSHLPPDVTARGIFTLSMKTFSNMISSAATQLVILISLGNQ